nr:hypothetical protein [Salinilacihabitans rarus]
MVESDNILSVERVKMALDERDVDSMLLYPGDLARFFADLDCCNSLGQITDIYWWFGRFLEQIAGDIDASLTTEDHTERQLVVGAPSVSHRFLLQVACLEDCASGTERDVFV